MAIYGIGANYEGDDVSGEFIKNNLAGVGWNVAHAPELHQFIASLTLLFVALGSFVMPPF